MKIEVDLGAALRKTAALKLVPKAARKQLQSWGAKAVKLLKYEAASMKKSGSGRKTSQLARAVGMKMDDRTLTVGTNLQKQTDVKYASIQDVGGTIRPKGHPYLAIPLKGIKDRPKDHPNAFVIESKKGNVLLVEQVFSKVRGKNNPGWRGSGYKTGLRALFVLKTEVTLPATRWFSGTMQMMDAILPQYMNEETLLEVSGKMSGMSGGES